MSSFLLKASLTLTTLLVPVLSFSAYYDERPDIFNVQAKDHDSISNPAIEMWQMSARGQMLFLAQILTFFPMHEYYFLARDIEYTYDMAKVLLRGVPEVNRSLHLVPISTALSESAELPDYLLQQGVSRKKLGGRAALFIDSCCEGSVPNNIIDAYNKIQSKVEIRGFLIQTDQFPSSKLAETAGADGSDIEELPHYTQSAIRFKANDQGLIRVVAEISEKKEKSNAKKIMEKIRFDFDNDKARFEFRDIVLNMQILYSYFSKDGLHEGVTETQATEAAYALAEKHQVSISSFLNDVVQLARKKYARVASQVEVDKFLQKHPEIAKKEKLSLVKRAILEPSQFNVVIQNHGGREESFIHQILSLLIDATPESLGLTKAQLGNLAQEWIELFRTNLKIYLPNKEVQELYFALAMKHSSPLDFIKIIGQIAHERQPYIDKPYVDEPYKVLRRALFSAMKADEYSLKRGSVIDFLLHSEESPLVDSEYLYKRVLRHLVEELDPETLVKLLPILIASADDLVFRRVESQEALSALIKNVQRGVERIPKINRALVKAYVESPDFSGRLKEKSVRRFNRWLFSQKEHFDESALKLSVPSDFAGDLLKRKGNSSVPESSIMYKVADLVQLFSQSASVFRCRALFAMK